MYPVAAQDMQNQSSQWLNVRRDKSRLHGPVWLGRHEQHRRQGGGRASATRWTSSSRSGGRARTTRAARRTAPRVSRPSTGMRPARTSRPSRTSRNTSSTRGSAKAAEGQGRRGSLQSRRLQLDADRRRHPQRPEDHRQEGGDRRGCAPRTRDHQPRRARLKELGLEGFAATRSSSPAPTITATWRPSCSNGTARSG